MITLVLGGARSGKSEVAERLAAASGAPVTYVATAVVDGADEDLAARVAAHRARRPATWTTVEPPDDLPATLGGLRDTVLLDALGTWLAARSGFADGTGGLCRALAERAGHTIVVSDEVGLGVHPATEAGRRFRDALGTLNRDVAGVADEVLLVVAGRVLRLEPA